MNGFARNTIIVGTVYNVFHEEYPTDESFFERVDRDIALMKASNINHALVFPVGQWDPETRKHRWTRTDRLIGKLEEAGLWFVPLMLKEEQDRHYLPIWALREIPGLWERYATDNRGENNRDNVDFADRRIFPLVEEYFKEVIARYGKSPALSFYNIWNEPHYSSASDHVVEQFREWLRRKYGTLALLRRAWAEDYTAWDEVSPFLTESWASSMPQIDWILFRNELNGILLGSLTKILRKYDTVHPVNANPVGTPWASFHAFGAYEIDDAPIADRNDIHGISYYPDAWEREHSREPCPFWMHNLAFNTIRSSAGEKDYILTELYTNAQNGLALNGYLTKSFVGVLAWTALANDCKGMIYWKWSPFMRGRQSLGRGLTRVDGALAPRGEAVRDLGAVVKRYGDILLKARLQKPQAAILVDMVGLLKTLAQSTEPATNRFMYESNAGLFRALFEGNLPVDFIRMDRGLDPGTLRHYRIVYLPFQIVMRKTAADTLKEYVRQGGWIVADARTATLDEQDFAYATSPGAGLDELFGAVRLDWEGREAFFTVKMGAEPGDGVDTFEGRYFREQLRPTGPVDVLGAFADTGEPAVIRNRYGEGGAILSAVPLGASCYGSSESSVGRLIRGFAASGRGHPRCPFHFPGEDLPEPEGPYPRRRLRRVCHQCGHRAGRGNPGDED